MGFAGGLLVLLGALSVRAAVGGRLGPPRFDDRVMAIAAEVRCPVCNGESAAQSDSEPSLHIRQEIAQGLEAGLSEHRILTRIAAEYGTWILYRPPGHGPLAVAWYFPVLGLAALSGLVAWYLRRRAVVPAPAGEGPPPAEPDASTPREMEETQRRLCEFL